MCVCLLLAWLVVQQRGGSQPITSCVPPDLKTLLVRIIRPIFKKYGIWKWLALHASETETNVGLCSLYGDQKNLKECMSTTKSIFWLREHFDRKPSQVATFSIPRSTTTASASPQVLLGVRALQTKNNWTRGTDHRTGETNVTPSDSFFSTERHDWCLSIT